MSVPAQHQVSTMHKLKPMTKEFNITTHEPENLENYLSRRMFDSLSIVSSFIRICQTFLVKSELYKRDKHFQRFTRNNKIARFEVRR